MSGGHNWAQKAQMVDLFGSNINFTKKVDSAKAFVTPTASATTFHSLCAY